MYQYVSSYQKKNYVLKFPSTCHSFPLRIKILVNKVSLYVPKFSFVFQRSALHNIIHKSQSTPFTDQNLFLSIKISLQVSKYFFTYQISLQVLSRSSTSGIFSPLDCINRFVVRPGHEIFGTKSH